ncbi:E2 domain-containing protein [Roseobacter weihaiensis]|uniref:E2 domain-containing protein n=1 Tax=Roseobacter weihaiensis TaxID=2763262 RepID=UPI0029CAB9F8|nr:E2 domain-containing protein [Roseobacter sp. H9]
MNSLRLLLKHTPSWVRVEKDGQATAKVTCAPQKASGLIAGNYLLKLALLHGGGVSAAEDEVAHHFPVSCPERHINPDATFCISYGSTEPLIEAHAAIAWWEYLRMFLLHQEYARKYGVWPLEGGLSHGDAARIQEKMEELAAPLGWKEEILVGMFRGKGWLANSLPKASHRLDRLLNSRTPCPRGCTRQADSNRSIVCRPPDTDREKTGGKPILRAECPNRSALERIALLEHRRRKAQHDFIQDICKDAPKCCGTMKYCPLAKSSS